MKERKKLEKKKETNNRLIKDRIIRDIKTLFEQEEDYYKPQRVSNVLNNNYIEYENNVDQNRNLSLDEYLNKIEPYLRNIIVDLQNSDTWKIQLTIAINFISSKVAEEERVMHSRSNNIKFTSYNDANQILDELFESLHPRYQENLEISLRGSDFIFDSVQLMYYKCHKVNFKLDGSYIDYPNWIKKKKATINPQNEDDKWFQYAATAALNYAEIESHPERVSNIKPFINKYNWKGINYPSKINDWKTFEKNNPIITLDILFNKENEICPAYISKINSNYEKQIILLVIPSEEKER